MGYGVFNPREAADAAVLAARQAIEGDADDWRSYADLANALVKRNRYLSDLAGRNPAQEAIVAARRAVALAPDEPDAHLALADALLAVFPRRIGTRAAAFAEMDRAELLGMDARDLAGRREQSKGLGYYVFYWTSFLLLLMYGIDGVGGKVGMAIAWPAMAVFIVAVAVFRARSRGQSFRETLEVKRKLSRLRLPTDVQVAQSAPLGVAIVALVLDTPTGWMAIPGVDGNAPPMWSAWVMAAGIPLFGVAAWIGVDRWLRPGTVLRLLRHEPYVAWSVAFTFILATVTTASVLLKVQRPGIWFTLFLVQIAWMIGGLIAGSVISSRRKPANSRRTDDEFHVRRGPIS